MEIQKVFSNIEDPEETLYSVLIRENEVALFSESQKADKLRKLVGKITLGGLIYGGKKESTTRNVREEQDVERIESPSKTIGIPVKLNLPCNVGKGLRVYGGPVNKIELERKISSILDKCFEESYREYKGVCKEHGYTEKDWKTELELCWIDILDSGYYVLNFICATKEFIGDLGPDFILAITIDYKTNQIFNID